VRMPLCPKLGQHLSKNWKFPEARYVFPSRDHTRALASEGAVGRNAVFRPAS
jgi:hypothetical protein